MPSIPLEIKKRDDEQRLVFGFAKFSEDPDNRGHLLVDKQGDTITPEDLEASAYDYALAARDAGEMHVTKGAGTLVESVVITPEKLEAWGIEKNAVPIGWWVGYKVHEVEKGQPDPWDKIKSDDYQAFSVEGVANRVPIGKRDDASDLVNDPALPGYVVETIEKTDDLSNREARAQVLEDLRMARITPAEADEALRMLVREQKELEEALDEPMPDDVDTGTVLAVFRRLLGVNKMDDNREEVSA